MKNIPQDMSQGSTHQTNDYGSIEVIQYIDSLNVVIIFSDTGRSKIARTGDIRRGQVKDNYRRNVYSIGYIGDGDYRSSINKKPTIAYAVWHSMIERCYCPSHKIKFPSYKDCRVDSRWHNFQNFAAWFKVNYKRGMQIDKDIKIEGNKIYSPETCIFVTPSENVVKAKAKNFSFLSPALEIIFIYNLRSFCRSNNLNHRAMSAVHSKKRLHHKGWVKA